ncbi:MAG TPA: L,D-transpeptidase family protein [Sphingomonas sp.]|nr:L,D-transpeptidase family protein [Sphingomonas sp.]
MSLAPSGTASAAAPLRAVASAAPDAVVAAAIKDEAGGDLKRFYRHRGYRPLWVEGRRLGPQAEKLVSYLATAWLDGLKPKSYDPDELVEAIGKARDGDPKALAEAELALSETFANYVRDQRRPSRDVDIIYADKKLKPGKLKTEQVLIAASFPKSFTNYVDDMGWMSEKYVMLRGLMARAAAARAPAPEIARLRINMDRARILPSPWVRHVEVDASSGRLWYYEAGKQVGTMRVVVGAKETQTPMLVGALTWAIVNPYWNVPTYLARGSIAKKVASGRSLKAMHIEALSDWTPQAQVVPASQINWPAVVSGAQDIRLRQLPGPYNSMGKVKFLFPNDEGIYLHDTPERDLLRKSDRHFSNGCIRLEKAMELGRWLLQRPVPTKDKKPEDAIPLPVSVPVYLTYITAEDTKKGVSFRPDVYGRDFQAD